MTYGHLRADCLYTGISSGPNARYRVWESLYLYLLGPNNNFRVTVSKTVRPMLSDRSLSCLSVTLVYCGQKVGWIKVKLGMQVRLGPGHIFFVLDDGPDPPTPKGHSPHFGAYLLWPTGWMD